MKRLLALTICFCLALGACDEEETINSSNYMDNVLDSRWSYEFDGDDYEYRFANSTSLDVIKNGSLDTQDYGWSMVEDLNYLFIWHDDGQIEGVASDGFYITEMTTEKLKLETVMCDAIPCTSSGETIVLEKVE